MFKWIKKTFFGPSRKFYWSSHRTSFHLHKYSWAIFGNTHTGISYDVDKNPSAKYFIKEVAHLEGITPYEIGILYEELVGLCEEYKQRQQYNTAEAKKILEIEDSIVKKTFNMEEL